MVNLYRKAFDQFGVCTRRKIRVSELVSGGSRSTRVGVDFLLMEFSPWLKYVWQVAGYLQRSQVLDNQPFRSKLSQSDLDTESVDLKKNLVIVVAVHHL